jgi:sigma-70-like protein
MLAEKFFLILETIISRHDSDDAPRVMSSSSHVPVKLPAKEFLPPQFGRILAKLPDDQRAVLLCAAMEGHSYPAAAKVLNLPIGAGTSCPLQAGKTRQGEIEGLADVAPSNIVRLEIPK